MENVVNNVEEDLFELKSRVFMLTEALKASKTPSFTNKVEDKLAELLELK